MSRFESDTIKRQIRQLGELVAAIVARARVEADYGNGLEAMRQATGTAFGPDRSVLDQLDAASAVLLLRDAELARSYAQVLIAEAGMNDGLGEVERAGSLRRRAALVEAATRTLPGTGPAAGVS